MKFLLIGVEDRRFDALMERLGATLFDLVANGPGSSVCIQGSRDDVTRFLSDEPQPTPEEAING
jgi:hypothetical protein